MNELLLGAIAMASFVAALLFARFWRSTRDRFFLFFAAAFAIEGFDRFLIGVSASASEDAPSFYMLRFVSYLLIIVAIVDHNRPRSH
jgi:hypothetical protein